MNARHITALLKQADLIDLDDEGGKLRAHVTINRLLEGGEAKIAQRYVNQMEREERAEQRAFDREHKRRMKTDPEYRRIMERIDDRLEKAAPAPRPPFVGRTFGDAMLKGFDEQIAQEAIESQIELADEMSTGWYNAFVDWSRSCDELSDTFRKAEKLTEQQKQEQVARFEWRKEITTMARRRFFHSLAAALVVIRDDVAAWVEHEYPGDPEAQFVSGQIREVRDPLEFHH